MKKASLAGAFFVSAIWLSAAQAFCPVPARLDSATVQRVVDGEQPLASPSSRARTAAARSSGPCSSVSMRA